MASNYVFVNNVVYRFHWAGQGKSIATTGDGTDVHVVASSDASERQLWIADVEPNDLAVRFKNYFTLAYLEKNEGNDDLKAESKEHKPDFQFFEASQIGKDAWNLYLFKGPVRLGVLVDRRGPDDWLTLVPSGPSVFSIENTGIIVT